MSVLARLDPILGGIGYAGRVTDRLVLAGEIETATQLAEDNCKRLLARRFDETAGWRRALAYRWRRTYSEDAKQACLAAVYEALAALPVRPFIAFGTLLGAVREGRFLPYDNDLDIGIFLSESTVDPIRARLIGAGFVECLYEGPSWPCRLKALHSTGVSVDVVFFRDLGDITLTYMRHLGWYIERRRQPFDLEPTRFAGVSVWRPAHPDRFLAENYGDWAVPARVHHPLLTSRLTSFDLPIVRYEAARFLYRLLTRGEITKANAISEVVRDHMRGLPAEPFWHDINQTLRERVAP